MNTLQLKIRGYWNLLVSQIRKFYAQLTHNKLAYAGAVYRGVVGRTQVQLAHAMVSMRHKLKR